VPALERGRWVLCDRFTDATYAYQDGGRGIPAAQIGILEKWVHKSMMPDLTLLLDLPPELGLERAGKRSAPDRFERETIAFFRRVRQTYLDRARAEPGRIRLVDASLPLSAVEKQVSLIVEAFISSWRY
jgi:dTMP kinase